MAGGACVALALALWLLPGTLTAQGGYLDVAGVRLYYEVEGPRPAPVLVLVHGWTTDARYWDDQMPAFRARYRVVRYDRRGYGRSGGIPDLSADPADLDALLAHFDIPRAAVLRHSEGAVATQAFALAYPARVRALVLAGPGPPPDFGLPWAGPDSIPFAEVARVARTEGVDSIWRLFRGHPLIGNDSLPPEAAARLGRIQASYRGADLLTPVPPSRPDRLPTLRRLPEIRAPTLVLTAERELPYLRVVAEAVAYGIPQAQKVVLRGGGHLVSLSQPAAFNRAVLAFLDSLPP